jgi:hypothetical protein
VTGKAILRVTERLSDHSFNDDLLHQAEQGHRWGKAQLMERAGYSMVFLLTDRPCTHSPLTGQPALKGQL